MKDQYNRTIDYMRISVTDRCNLRCRYCMPEDLQLVSMARVLTYEEIIRICRAAAKLGIKKLKVTGGEPLVRKGCPALVRELKQIPGIEQVTLTTNGVVLHQYLHELIDAGLDAVNISLDTLDRERYREITGKNELQAVLDSIQSAVRSGIRTKLNTVLMQGVNDDEWEQIAKLAEHNRLDVRFIEMMPIGYGKSSPGVSGAELYARMKHLWPDIIRDTNIHGNGPAVYYHVPGWAGSIGLINAIHGRFCSGCNRIRLTSMGELKPCLCYGDTIDLMPILRRSELPGGQNIAALETEQTTAADAELCEAIGKAVMEKPLQHCFEKPGSITEEAQMVKIGG